MHAIEPCPSISSGVGRVVTGTFTHVRGGILRIKLAGLAEPLGVTSNHSIYSADRLDFVPAGELRVGETLRNLDGDVRIESIEQLGSEERVYNLEIHGEHVFRVASSGVLVHNSSGAEGSVTTGNAFPRNPNDLLPGVPRTVKPNGNQVIYPSEKVRIRAETHPIKPGETHAPRHHDQHYHVEIRIDPTKSWNNPNNVQKVLPPNYQPGYGTGFLPGETFPGM